MDYIGATQKYPGVVTLCSRALLEVTVANLST